MINTLQLDVHASGVAVITINRPDSRNALDLKSMRAFAGAVEVVSADTRLRALIVTGAGDQAFCAGADLAEMDQHPTAENGAAMIALMGDALLTLEQLPIPVIAAINGYALGGGAELAVACDLRVVDANVQMGFVHAKRGVIPGWGGGQRLLRLIGYARAMEILLTARTLTADDPDLQHIVMRPIAPQGQAFDAAMAVAESIAELDPAVTASMKAMLRAGLPPAAFDYERSLFPPLWAGEARRAATRAFLERSKGNSQ